VDYWDAIDYILALPDWERFSSGTGGMTMSLQCMKELLKRLDHPERGRKTIHITGSKGKGSTSTMIASVLHERGLKTALFTSPHLHDYNERISFEMLPISRFDFADGLQEIRDVLDEVNTSDVGPVSTFGALLALFFYLCRKNRVEWQIVEVGLGGKSDATNIFDKKEAAVITAISLEHTQILGDTCGAIAAEKAGIIIPGCTTIMAPQNDGEAATTIIKAAKKAGSKLVEVGKSYKVFAKSHDSGGQSFVIESPHRKYDLHTMMLGMHQLQNAATAVATIESVLGTTDEDAWAIEDGMGNAEISGRVEQLTRHPLVVVDGAHNRDSMKALVATLERHFDFERCLFVLGCNTDKNVGAMLDVIAPLSPKAIIATRSSSQKAMPPEQIAELARERKLETHVTQNIEQALAIVRELAEHNDLVCITGSLYVVGEARQSILSLPVTH
jgi:dihydrofolate synthase / folylpolyglutamate synthase